MTRRLPAAVVIAVLIAALARVPALAVEPGASADPVVTLEDQPTTVTMSASDPDGGSITGFDIVTGPTKGTLGAPTAPDCTGFPTCTATVDYTPDPDANGSDSFTFTATDDTAETSGEATADITITPVNDPPAFAAGPDQLVLEDAGPQVVSGWATDTSAGPTDEGSQSLSFEITSNTNAALFAVEPAVASDGTLSYTPAPDANGSATVGVRLTDDGGAADGGLDASGDQAFSITVSPVNDPPTFTPGADQSASEDAGPQAVPGWASDIHAGPADEDATQVVAFAVVGNDNPDLFAVQPAIDGSSGALTYRPATNATGSATITTVAIDDGGVADGGGDTSDPATFTITVDGANDPPIAGNDLATVRVGGPTAIDVRANDSGGPDEPGDPFLITAVSEGSRGIVTITGGGTGLTYDPIGCSTGSDVFSYTLTDGGGLTDTGTVLVTISSPSAYPTADAPRPFFVTHSTIGSTVPVNLSWCGLTSGTTIHGYQLQQSKSAGAFATVITSTAKTSSIRSLSVSPAGYQFRVRMTDNKSRTSGYALGPAFRVVRAQDASASIHYSSGWSKATSSHLSGKTARYTTRSGRTATITFTGRAFAIVGTRGTTRGSFNVYLDGVKVTAKAISAKASKTLYRQVLYGRSVQARTHTVKIVTTTSKRVDLDAILWVATP